MGSKHETLLQKCSLLVQRTFPKSRFIVRHIGMFKTQRNTPIMIGIPGQGDAYIILHHNNELIHIELEFKVGSDKQSDKQKNWERVITDLGGLYILVRKEQDILTEIQKKWPGITMAI